MTRLGMAMGRAWLVGAVLVAAGWAAAWAAPQVILPSGQRLAGTAVKVLDDGQVVLMVGGAARTFPKGTQVVVDRPAELDRAAELIKARQYDRAVVVLEKLVADFRGLKWDIGGLVLLGQARLGAREAAKAVESFEAALALDATALSAGDARMDYVRALAAGGGGEKVEAALAETIVKGSRAAAAEAQVLRGKRRLAAGAVDEALLDFLRTADFFGGQTNAQAEATFRAAECLERLGDGRAQEYFARVVESFPGSEYAAEAARRKR